MANNNYAKQLNSAWHKGFEECLLEQFEKVDFMNEADSYDERDSEGE